MVRSKTQNHLPVLKDRICLLMILVLAQVISVLLSAHLMVHGEIHYSQKTESTKNSPMPAITLLDLHISLDQLPQASPVLKVHFKKTITKQFPLVLTIS